MNTLYLECSMGAAGDMIAAALFELLPDKEKMLDKLRSAGIPGVEFKVEKTVKYGIEGTIFSVFVHGTEEGAEDDHSHDHKHHHSTFEDIRTTVDSLKGLSDKVKTDVINVYSMLAEAESQVHGRPVDQIHFHEVGNLDAVADITSVCMFIEELSPERIIVSPVRTGYGTVKCAHGILPVPAPATAYLLKGVPIYSGDIEGEMCTPTGAALLKFFAGDYSPMPAMEVDSIGYGMGKRDFSSASCVRAFWGKTAEEDEYASELSCNVDDMTAEEISFVMDRLFEAGAYEVYTAAVGMKKSRPGTLLRVICDPKDRDKMIRLIFKYTSTIGLRETNTKCFRMDRSIKTVKTSLGEMRLKESSGFGTARRKYEYEDLAAAAKANGMTLQEVRNTIDLETE
ncbi:MAG: nickel pincer cofactor biosynthesis protein LarC [Clostridia bacterium]|nr:nickel pincer cofactor biosynthesis protein LarC [Clostridia bacterium]